MRRFQLIPDRLLMRRCIKVLRIHDVRIALKRIAGGNVYILRPGRRTDKNDRVGIVPANDRNDRIGIGLYGSPVRPVRFVADFIQNVLLAGVFSGHFIKEDFCLIDMLVGVAVGQNMPVDNDILPRGFGRLHAAIDDRLQFGLVSTGAVTAVFPGTAPAGSLAVHLGIQKAEYIFIYVLRHVVQSERTESLQNDFLIVLIQKLRSRNVERF